MMKWTPASPHSRELDSWQRDSHSLLIEYYDHDPIRKRRIQALKQFSLGPCFEEKHNRILAIRVSYDQVHLNTALALSLKSLMHSTLSPLLRPTFVSLPKPLSCGSDRHEIKKEGQNLNWFVRFVDEENLYDELSEAGLGVLRREGDFFFLKRGPFEIVRSAPLKAEDLRHILKVWRFVERHLSPSPPPPSWSSPFLKSLNLMRQKGARCRSRRTEDRLALRRLITRMDPILPGKRGCLRRAFLEIALDAGAASEPLLLGIDLEHHGGIGHAWLKSDASSRKYDAQFEL